MFKSIWVIVFLDILKDAVKMGVKNKFKNCGAGVLAFSLLGSVNGADVNLAWDPSPDANVTKYNIYYRPVSGGQYSMKSSLTTTNVVRGLLNNVTYEIYATAVVGTGTNSAESVPSNKIAYTPGGINLGAGSDTNAPNMNLSSGIQSISDLFPLESRAFFPEKGSAKNPYISYLYGTMSDTNGIMNVKLEGNSIISYKSNFDYFTNSNFGVSYDCSAGTNLVNLVAEDFSGNKRTNSLHIIDLARTDNNMNGMSDKEEIMRGIDPFKTHKTFIRFNNVGYGTICKDVRIDFSALSSRPYYALSSEDLEKPLREWLVESTYKIWYTEELDGTRTGHFGEHTHAYSRFYKILDSYDFERLGIPFPEY